MVFGRVGTNAVMVTFAFCVANDYVFDVMTLAVVVAAANVYVASDCDHDDVPWLALFCHASDSDAVPCPWTYEIQKCVSFDDKKTRKQLDLLCGRLFILRATATRCLFM